MDRWMIPINPFATALAVALATLQVGRAATQEVAPSDVISLSHCPVDFEQAALLGAGQPGVVQEVAVRLGDRVRIGQVMGRLRDGDALAELQLKRAQAESDIAIRTQEAKYAQMLGRLRSAEPLKERNYVSREQFELLKLEVETAALEIEAERHRRLVAEILARQAEELVRQREFASPFDGMVVDILKRPGESVGLNDPVFRVVDTDHLRVTGYLDVVDAWRVKPGQRCRFIPEVGGADLSLEERRFSGKVAFVDAAIDPQTQTCRVIAAIENPGGLLRAGLEGRLEIEPGTIADDEPAPSRWEEPAASGLAPEGPGPQHAASAATPHEPAR